MIYTPEPLSREALDQLPGWTLVEFGANGCPHCMAAQPAIESAIGNKPGLTHIKVEDGRGRPLGRSFRVKLWPTLVLLQNGQVRAQVVRPRQPQDLDEITRWTDSL
ncbi:MAG: thioredoxin family protein [Lautropia sp.]|nr:thioredoxin family protein [Lautropia sp.]